MYQKFKILVLLIIVASLFQSCGDVFKKKNHKDDRIKWSFNYKEVTHNPLKNYAPAIDEDGNIYFWESPLSKATAYKLSPSGKEIWKKSIGSAYSRLIYHENKLYFVNKHSLRCVNAENGEIIWTTENTSKGNSGTIALTPTRIYTVNTVADDVTSMKSTLEAYDLSGNKIWEKFISYVAGEKGATMTVPYTIAVNGNKIYLASLIEDFDNNNSPEMAVVAYTDNGNDATKDWAWIAPEKFSFDGQQKAFIGDLAIADNGDILFTMAKSGVQSVFSISNTGTTNWTAPITAKNTVVNIVIDGNGSAYTSYDVIDKVAEGSLVWSSKINAEWAYDGVTSMGTVISDAGSISAVNFNSILTTVDANGEVKWEQYYESYDDGYNNFYNVVINRNGDILVINKFGLKAYEGDGKPLATKGWPKIYGNYANTSSR